MNHFRMISFFAISKQTAPWYAHLVNLKATRYIPPYFTKQEKDQFYSQVKFFYWDDPYLFKYYPDQIVRKCDLDLEFQSILQFCHTYACASLNDVGQ